MRPWMKTVRSLPFCAISLTACQSPPAQVEFAPGPALVLPAALLLPNKGPFRPPAGATQRAAALIIEDFVEALEACNTDKAALAKIFQDYEEASSAMPAAPTP